MTKFLLLRGSQRPMETLDAELTATGELLDAQTLTGPDLAVIVTCEGDDPPVVTDGPSAGIPPSSIRGYWLVDVESRERAIEIAARVSAGEPIEVRQLMGGPPADL